MNVFNLQFVDLSWHLLYVKETRAEKEITFEGNASLNNFSP